MNVCLDQNVDTTNTIQLNLNIFVFAPIPHLTHVFAPSVEFLVAFDNDCVLRQAVRELSAFVGLDP